VLDQDRFRLSLFVLGVAAVHALCLAAVLPMLITLPGFDEAARAIVDIEVIRPAPGVMTVSAPAETPAAPAPVTTAPAPANLIAAEAPIAEPHLDDATAALPQANHDLSPPAATNAESPSPEPATVANPDLGSVPAAESAPAPSVEPAEARPATQTLANVSPEPVSAPPPAVVETPASEDAGEKSADSKDNDTTKAEAKSGKPAAKKRVAAKPRRQVRTQPQASKAGGFGSFFGFMQPRPRPQRATSAR
jgi:hypothetical protein